MNLTNLSDNVEIQEFKINGEWHMRGTKAEWNEVVLPQHPDIRYSKVSPHTLTSACINLTFKTT